MTRKRPLIALLLVSFLLSGSAILAAPQPASACLWNVAHYFNPWPPCAVKDENVIQRVRSLNARIATGLVEFAVKIQQVKREIYSWQRAYETATGWEAELKRVYGDVTANPIPSLVSTFNRSNMGSYVAVDYQGGFSFSGEIVDAREIADSIKGQFQNATDIERIWNQSIFPRMEQQYDIMGRTGRAIENELANLGDFDAHYQELRDSLTNVGARTADRYTTTSEAAGDAESDISYLSALLSRLRGTSYETQVRAIHTRIRAIEYATEKQGILSRRAGTRASYMFY